MVGYTLRVEIVKLLEIGINRNKKIILSNNIQLLEISHVQEYLQLYYLE